MCPILMILDGQVYAWGQNNHFQLGVESDQQSFLSVPIPVASLQSVPVVFVSSGFAHNVAVTAGGVALSWGRNRYITYRVSMYVVLKCEVAMND